MQDMASWVEELPSGNWRARYTAPDGKKQSAGTFPHKRAAEKAANVAEAETQVLGWRDPKAAGRTWGEWCAEWWPTRPVSKGTLKRDTSPRDKHLMERWGSVPLIDITRHDVKAWAANLARGGLSPASVQRYMHLFSGSLTAAVDAEIIATNPAYRLALPGGQTDVMRFLTYGEVTAVLAATDDPLVPLLFGTGLRWGEGAGLQGKRLDARRGQLRVAEVWDSVTRTMSAYPKGRKIRDVPVPEDVVARLEPLVAKRGEGMLFDYLDIDNWRKRVWNPTIRRAGLDGVRIHDARHTYASHLLQAGVSLARVGQLLGHESPSTTQRYAFLMETSHDDILAALRGPHGVDVGKTTVADGSLPLHHVAKNPQ